MSRVFRDNPDIMELMIPPDSFFFQWYPGDRARIFTHGLHEGGIGAFPLTGVMKADNAKKLIEEYEDRYKRGEKIYKLINPIEKYDIKKGEV